MERELWLLLYAFVSRSEVVGKGWRYSTATIVMVYLWAVVHDRPMCWAVDRRNWPKDLCPWPLPSQSQLSRRMRGSDVVELMTEIEHQFSALVGGEQRLIRIIDGKPLDVSNVSKDADAGYGRAAGGMHKGYKMHVVNAGGPTPQAWALSPMNVSEKTIAAVLIPTLAGTGYLLGDGEYDTNHLHDAAHAAGYQLVAPKRGKGDGLGHHRHSPYRLRCIELLKGRFGKALRNFRKQIEREFGALVSFGGGLACLPPWVRRFHRVRNWVHAKILINAIRWFRVNNVNLTALA